MPDPDTACEAPNVVRMRERPNDLAQRQLALPLQRMVIRRAR
ncbi:hypothetical protein [Leptolyngbya sp. FACHB-261]|nr:hypothetical protein [Leptolyngbya sp. FACHB-261]